MFCWDARTAGAVRKVCAKLPFTFGPYKRLLQVSTFYFCPAKFADFVAGSFIAWPPLQKERRGEKIFIAQLFGGEIF